MTDSSKDYKGEGIAPVQSDIVDEGVLGGDEGDKEDEEEMQRGDIRAVSGALSLFFVVVRPLTSRSRRQRSLAIRTTRSPSAARTSSRARARLAPRTSRRSLRRRTSSTRPSRTSSRPMVRLRVFSPPAGLEKTDAAAFAWTVGRSAMR